MTVRFVVQGSTRDCLDAVNGRARQRAVRVICAWWAATLVAVVVMGVWL